MVIYLNQKGGGGVVSINELLEDLCFRPRRTKMVNSPTV